MEPKVSICRRSKKFCLFDGFKSIGDFTSYKDESEAIAAAKEYFKDITTKEVEIVYPRIDKIEFFYD